MGGVLRTILIVLVLLGVASAAGYFLGPKTASRSESFTIERPAATVFARLASTPAGAVIAEGVTLTEISSAEGETITGAVTYADAATGHVTYTVTPEGEAAKVVVKLDRDLGPNPINRLQAITGGPVGPLVTAAAAAVTADLTALPEESFVGLAYELVDVPAQPFFYVENCSASDAESITSIISQAVAGIPPVMRTNGLTATGPLTAVEPRVVTDQYCYQVGYPYRGRQPRALLFGKTGQTPGGTLLRMVYTGTEDDVMTKVYNPMDALLAAAHLDDPGIRTDDWATFEVYHDDATQAGGSRNREIFYVAQGDLSRLTAIQPPTTPAAIAPAATPEAPATPAAEPAAPAPATPPTTP
jgi:hypothetical protein